MADCMAVAGKVQDEAEGTFCYTRKLRRYLHAHARAYTHTHIIAHTK